MSCKNELPYLKPKHFDDNMLYYRNPCNSDSDCYNNKSKFPICRNKKTKKIMTDCNHLHPKRIDGTLINDWANDPLFPAGCTNYVHKTRCILKKYKKLMPKYRCYNDKCVPGSVGDEFSHYDFNKSCLNTETNLKIDKLCVLIDEKGLSLEKDNCEEIKGYTYLKDLKLCVRNILNDENSCKAIGKNWDDQKNKCLEKMDATICKKIGKTWDDKRKYVMIFHMMKIVVKQSVKLGIIEKINVWNFHMIKIVVMQPVKIWKIKN